MFKIDVPKKIIIIGAGISGLSAGIYGQKNGYLTEIFEKNPSHGGLCVSWERDNFPIDGCVHWMTGTRKGTEMYSMWKELGAFTHRNIVYSDNFGTVEYKGESVTFWCDLNRLERELIDISPDDKKMIKKTVKMIYKIQNMPLPTDIPLSAMSLKRKIKFVFRVFPYLWVYWKTITKSKEEFASKFKSPLLQYAFSHIVPGDGNAYSALYAYGTVALGNGGTVKGGSSMLSDNMAKSYKDHGGEIHYNSPVEEILIENKKAVGIKLKNGEIHKADYVISACDITETYKFLHNKYRVRQFDKRFNNPEAYPVPSCVYVSLKIDYEEFKKLRITDVFEFECEDFLVGNRQEKSIKFHVYSYDETFIKDGNVLMTVLVHQTEKDYEYWELMHKDYKKYLEEKKRVGEAILIRLEKRFPTLAGKMKVIDVTSPKTYNRYTNAYHGAYMPFSFTSKGSIYYSNGLVKRVKNLMLAGQWTLLPGGLPIAMMSGKFAIQRLLKKDERWYKITKPIRFIYEKNK